MTTRLERQLLLEKEASSYSYERLMKEVSSRVRAGQADELAEGKMILLHSIDAVAEKLSEFFDVRLPTQRGKVREVLATEFYDEPKELALIILVTIVRSISEEEKIKATALAYRIVRAIHESMLVRQLDNGNTALGTYIDKRYKKRNLQFRTKEKLKIIKRQSQLKRDELTPNALYLGAAMIDIVIKSGVNIIEMKDVYHNARATKFILYTEECYKMVLESRERLLAEYRKYPIFLVKPKDWTGFNGSAGYYTEELYSTSIIKSRSSSRKLLKAFFTANPSPSIYSSLNTLQATAWRINHRVFDVLHYVFDKNIVDTDSERNNPYLLGRLPYNGLQEPEDFININNYGVINLTGKYKGLPVEKTMMRKYFKDLEDQRDRIISNAGKAIMLNLVVANAREYVAEEEIYFSYQYDFRGRIYPVQQHLQPQGKGESKALLEFKHGSRITTEDELDWFKIHGANCYGVDKETYGVRINTINDLEEDIKLIAEDPIRHRLLWKDTDSPYQYLAWCFEYADYLKDPETFVSHLPIALDATCSGIQIYSGLLRDNEGAESVNVVGSIRNDIYQEVADKVNGYLAAGDYTKFYSYVTNDGEEHVESTVALADSIKGKITRSLTKRNTMTQPYSVTKFGMFEQLKVELSELEDNGKKFWIGENWLMTKLLTDLNARAIDETVKGAKVGQMYLKGVTADLVKQGKWVFYTAPLTSFPVLQKVHVQDETRVSTPIGKLTIRTTSPLLKASSMISGIAPNYIHSLDAALLSTTVMKLKDDGCVNFHLIHDSYAVPINYVANLNKRVRESFIELFKTNPLQQFVEQVNPTYSIRPEEVLINTLNLDRVLDSRYIFS